MGHAAGSSGVNSRHGGWYEPPSGSMVELAGLSMPPDGAPGRVGRHRSSGQGAGKGRVSRGAGGTSVMRGSSTAAAQRRGELLMLTQPGAPFPTAKRASRRRRRRRARPSGTVAADLWRDRSGKSAHPRLCGGDVDRGGRRRALLRVLAGRCPCVCDTTAPPHGAGHSPSRSARPPSAPRRQQQQQPRSAAGQGRRRPCSAAASAGRGARRSGSRSSALTAMSAELRQLSESWVTGPTASREAIEVTS